MERITSKSWSGVVYYVDAKHNLALEPCEMNAHQVRLTIEKLEKYENTGMTPDEINALRERDVAKTPEKVSNSGIRYTDDYICPNCGKHFTGTGIAEFCYHCGQRLKWED